MTTIDAIKSGATLIDVREPFELETDGSIERAINIPMGEVEERLEEIKKMKTPIVVFCRVGGRAASVISYLKENGIEEVFNGGGCSDVSEILNEE